MRRHEQRAAQSGPRHRPRTRARCAPARRRRGQSRRDPGVARRDDRDLGRHAVAGAAAATPAPTAVTSTAERFDEPPLLLRAGDRLKARRETNAARQCRGSSPLCEQRSADRLTVAQSAPAPAPGIERERLLHHARDGVAVRRYDERIASPDHSAGGACDARSRARTRVRESPRARRRNAVRYRRGECGRQCPSLGTGHPRRRRPFPVEHRRGRRSWIAWFPRSAPLR